MPAKLPSVWVAAPKAIRTGGHLWRHLAPLIVPLAGQGDASTYDRRVVVLAPTLV